MSFWCIINGRYYASCPFGSEDDYYTRVIKYASWLPAHGRAVAYFVEAYDYWTTPRGSPSSHKVHVDRGSIFYHYPPSGPAPLASDVVFGQYGSTSRWTARLASSLPHLAPSPPPPVLRAPSPVLNVSTPIPVAPAISATKLVAVSGVSSSNNFSIYKAALKQGLFKPTYNSLTGQTDTFQLPIPYSSPRAAYHTYYSPPTVKYIPRTLDVNILEEVRVSTEDEKDTSTLLPRYSDNRGVGTPWSNGRVALAAGASSNQLVAGNFGFNVPANAVIKGVEITMDKSVPVGALASEVVNVMPCGFAAPFFNGDTAGLYDPGYGGVWNGTNWYTDSNSLLACLNAAWDQNITASKLVATVQFTGLSGATTGIPAAYFYIWNFDSMVYSYGTGVVDYTKPVTLTLIDFSNNQPPHNNLFEGVFPASGDAFQMNIAPADSTPDITFGLGTAVPYTGVEWLSIEFIK